MEDFGCQKPVFLLFSFLWSWLYLRQIHLGRQQPLLRWNKRYCHLLPWNRSDYLCPTSLMTYRTVCCSMSFSYDCWTKNGWTSVDLSKLFHCSSVYSIAITYLSSKVYYNGYGRKLRMSCIFVFVISTSIIRNHKLLTLLEKTRLFWNHMDA